MRTLKVLVPIIFGLILTLGLVGGLALARSDVAAPNTPTATILYVDADATGVANGLSWTDAFTNPQDALAFAISGIEIWVAEGIYYPDEGAGQINDVVSSTFVLTDGVALYGGFDPDSGADEFAERDWETYVTVLSGDIDHETLPDITDPHGVVTSTANLTGTNTYHVVSSDGVTVTAVIDGFNITAGQADNYPANKGGGMFNQADSRPTLSNMTFSGNWAGSGGGMHNENSSPSLSNVTFYGNSASSGGAMHNAGEMDYDTGEDGNSSPSLSNVNFYSNSASSGGAIANEGFFGYSNPSLRDVTFSGNSAGAGGAIYNISAYGSASPSLVNVIFFGNSARLDGGAIYNQAGRGSSSPGLTNVIFSGNSAGEGGGAIYNYSISFGVSSPRLTNVTFVSNSADYGGAIYTDLISTSSLRNVILWGNTAVISGSQIYNKSFSIYITNSLIQNGLTGGIEGGGTVVDGGGNIDADPLFVRNPDPGNNDYGDLHVQPGSPAIDNGTNKCCPAMDLDGNARPINFICDMGAYEFAPPIALAKKVNNPTPALGETITFTIQGGNYLTDTITGGLLSDTLPVGLNFLGPITLEPADAGSVGAQPPIFATNLTISYTQNVILIFPVIVSDELALGTQITNTVAFSATEVVTPVVGSVTFSIAKHDIYLPVVSKGQ